MISEMDLQRALGLTFQEFEQRLEDAFRDSNKKCLAVFSRREDLEELRDLIAKKATWEDHSAIQKNMGEMKKCLDALTEEVFSASRIALKEEFAKKVDRPLLDAALQLKADSEDVNGVMERLERLEGLVVHNQAKHDAALEAVLKRAATEERAVALRHEERLVESAKAVAALRSEHAAALARLAGAEDSIAVLTSAAEKLRKVHEAHSEEQQSSVLPRVSSLQEQLGKLEAAVAQFGKGLGALSEECQAFQQASGKAQADLSAQAKQAKQRLEALSEAAEAAKRRGKESGKNAEARFGELSTAQEKLAEQVAAFEKQLKRHEKEVRNVERSVKRAEATGTAVVPFPTAAPALEPNDRMRKLLEQLEKIAAGGTPYEHLGVEWDPKRPPLPFKGCDLPRPGAELPQLLPSASAGECGPVSARSAPLALLGGGLGCSPRTPRSLSCKR